MKNKEKIRIIIKILYSKEVIALCPKKIALNGHGLFIIALKKEGILHETKKAENTKE